MRPAGRSARAASNDAQQTETARDADPGTGSRRLGPETQPAVTRSGLVDPDGLSHDVLFTGVGVGEPRRILPDPVGDVALHRRLERLGAIVEELCDAIDCGLLLDRLRYRVPPEVEELFREWCVCLTPVSRELLGSRPLLADERDNELCYTHRTEAEQHGPGRRSKPPLRPSTQRERSSLAATPAVDRSREPVPTPASGHSVVSVEVRSCCACSPARTRPTMSAWWGRQVSTATAPSRTGRTGCCGRCDACRQPGQGTPPAGRCSRSVALSSVVSPQTAPNRSRWSGQPTSGVVNRLNSRNEIGSRFGDSSAAAHASHPIDRGPSRASDGRSSSSTGGAGRVPRGRTEIEEFRDEETPQASRTTSPEGEGRRKGNHPANRPVRTASNPQRRIKDSNPALTETGWKCDSSHHPCLRRGATGVVGRGGAADPHGCTERSVSRPADPPWDGRGE